MCQIDLELASRWACFPSWKVQHTQGAARIGYDQWDTRRKQYTVLLFYFVFVFVFKQLLLKFRAKCWVSGTRKSSSLGGRRMLVRRHEVTGTQNKRWNRRRQPRTLHFNTLQEGTFKVFILRRRQWLRREVCSAWWKLYTVYVCTEASHDAPIMYVILRLSCLGF